MALSLKMRTYRWKDDASCHLNLLIHRKSHMQHFLVQLFLFCSVLDFADNAVIYANQWTIIIASL